MSRVSSLVQVYSTFTKVFRLARLAASPATFTLLASLVFCRQFDRESRGVELASSGLWP